MRYSKANIRQLLVSLAAALILCLGLGSLIFEAKAAQLPNRSLLISSNLTSAVVTHRFSFDVATAGNIGSIRFLFCANNPLIGEPCTVPAGLDTSGATISSQTGETGFTVLPTVATNEITLTRAASAATVGPVSYTFENITNPDTEGSYYVRIQTYASADASGPDIDYGGLAYSINQPISVSAEVPPYLLFCGGVVITGLDCSTASGNLINFGELSTNQPKTGTTQILIATNAEDGYTLSVNGTTMLSGTHVIPAIGSQDVSRPGTSQFGINLVNNNDPNIGANPGGSGSAAVSSDYATSNRYQFVSGDVLASSTTSDAYRKYTVSYLVNVAQDQEAGVYVSTLTYVALASF